MIGTVHNLLVDSHDHTVRMLRIEHGGILGFGATASFLPVDAISQITHDTVYVNQSSQQVADAPGYDPDLADQMVHYTSVYGYYGFAPFWGGYPAGR